MIIYNEDPPAEQEEEASGEEGLPFGIPDE